MEKKNLVLAVPVAVVAIIIILAVGFNLGNMAKQQGDEAKVNIVIPSYLTKETNVESSGRLESYSDGVISFAADDSGEKIRLISVSGTVTKSASPDKAVIYLSIETLDKSASKSQADNAELASKVVEALKEAGIADKDIETSSYSLNEEYEWNDILKKSVSIGYRTTNSIKATVRNLDDTGKVIDAAVKAGANRVSSISFELSEDNEERLKAAALSEAAAAAKAKAESIASGLGIGVGQVYSASESSNYYTPIYRSYSKDLAIESAGATTPISAGDVEYSVSVSVQFEIQ